MPISDLFGEYAQLDAEIKALEAKQEQLRPHILQMMIDSGEDKRDIGVGKFSAGKRKVWTYPEEVLAVGEEFKAAKAKAESTGEATYEEVDQLKYTSVKL